MRISISYYFTLISFSCLSPPLLSSTLLSSYLPPPIRLLLHLLLLLLFLLLFSFSSFFSSFSSLSVSLSLSVSPTPPILILFQFLFQFLFLIQFLTSSSFFLISFPYPPIPLLLFFYTYLLPPPFYSHFPPPFPPLLLLNLQLLLFLLLLYSLTSILPLLSSPIPPSPRLILPFTPHSLRHLILLPALLIRCSFMAAVGCDSRMGQHIGLVAETWRRRCVTSPILIHAHKCTYSTDMNTHQYNSLLLYLQHHYHYDHYYSKCQYCYHFH